MEFEAAFKHIVDVADMFINEEEALALNMTDTKTVFNESHPLYNLLSFPYPNLFLPEARAEYNKIVNNEIRAQIMIRVRIKCMTIFALVGKDNISKLETNLYDAILRNYTDNNRKSRDLLERDLETFFTNNPCTWFCAIASSVFNNKLVAHSKAMRSKQTRSLLGTGQTIRKDAVGS